MIRSKLEFSEVFVTDRLQGDLLETINMYLGVSRRFYVLLPLTSLIKAINFKH